MTKENDINKSAGGNPDGIIFDIKRFAIHDGPGIRTTAFLKGCPLNCQWCHNPESISSKPNLLWRNNLCIKCKICVKACPNDALRFEPETQKLILDHDLCSDQNTCARQCPTEALQIAGKSISPSDLLLELEKDRIFYENSGGGVTFSGGEPLFQPEFLAQCLILCQKSGLHTTVDTSCYAETAVIDKIAPLADMFLCDIKIFDRDLHKKYTGVDNQQILANILRISNMGKPIIIRVPLIPDINDNEQNLNDIKDFASGIDSLIDMEYLPYNPAGIDKRSMIL